MERNRKRVRAEDNGDEPMQLAATPKELMEADGEGDDGPRPRGRTDASQGQEGEADERSVTERVNDALHRGRPSDKEEE